MKSKQELEDNFDWWITCIPDKVNRLEELIPVDIFKRLDYSLESFSFFGKYICDTIQSINDLKNEGELWDCYASYIGTTYRRNVPTAEWFIELEDEKNVYYGVPALRTEAKTTFVPMYEISAMIDRKRPDFLLALTKRHIELQHHQAP